MLTQRVIYILQVMLTQRVICINKLNSYLIYSIRCLYHALPLCSPVETKLPIGFLLPELYLLGPSIFAKSTYIGIISNRGWCLRSLICDGTKPVSKFTQLQRIELTNLIFLRILGWVYFQCGVVLSLFHYLKISSNSWRKPSSSIA